MRLTELSDKAADAESRRLILIINARRKKMDAWMNRTGEDAVTFDEDSAFVTGMRTLFRYARGMEIPPFAVHDFLDDLLDLMFAGLASGVLALPSFEKMSDRPWAVAWRAAELRFVVDGGEDIDARDLAHLLGMPVRGLCSEIASQTGTPFDGGTVPRGYVEAVWTAIKNAAEKNDWERV